MTTIFPLLRRNLSSRHLSCRCCTKFRQSSTASVVVTATCFHDATVSSKHDKNETNLSTHGIDTHWNNRRFCECICSAPRERRQEVGQKSHRGTKGYHNERCSMPGGRRGPNIQSTSRRVQYTCSHLGRELEKITEPLCVHQQGHFESVLVFASIAQDVVRQGPPLQ